MEAIRCKRSIGLVVSSLCACAAAHTAGTSSSGGAGSSSDTAGRASTVAAQSPHKSSAAAGSSATDGAIGGIDAAARACGEGFALHDAVGGAPCDERPVTACSSNAAGTGSLLAITSRLVADCSLILVENQLEIAFERGCANRVAIEHSQAGGVDPDAIACLVQRLGEQRLACLASVESDCVHFEVSTLATQ